MNIIESSQGLTELSEALINVFGLAIVFGGRPRTFAPGLVREDARERHALPGVPYLGQCALYSPVSSTVREVWVIRWDGIEMRTYSAERARTWLVRVQLRSRANLVMVPVIAHCTTSPETVPKVILAREQVRCSQCPLPHSPLLPTTAQAADTVSL